MPSIAPRPLALIRWLLLALLIAIVAAIVTDSFVTRWGFRGQNPRFGLVALVDGTAWRPYVYRRLSPEVIGLTASFLDVVLPDRVRRFLVEASPIRSYYQPPAGLAADTPEALRERLALLYHAAYAFVFLCHCGTLLVARALLRRVTGSRGMLPDFAPLVGLLLLPLTFLRGGYVYDSAELLLLTAYCWCLAAPRVGALIAVFTLAVLNKESNLALAVVAPTVLLGRLPHAAWRRVGIAQAVIGTAIVALYWYTFRLNPGTPIEWGFEENLAFWLDPRSYFGATIPYGPLVPMPRASSVYVLVLIAGLIAAGWPATPDWVKRGLVVALVVSLPLLLLFSWRDEVRVLALVFPFLFVAGTFGAARLYAGDAAVNRHEPGPPAVWQGPPGGGG